MGDVGNGDLLDEEQSLVLVELSVWIRSTCRDPV